MKTPVPLSETPMVRAGTRAPVGRIVPAAFILTALCAIAYLIQPGFIAYFNLKWMDKIEQNSSVSTEPATDSAPVVTVVEIDEASLSAYGQWPWPRYRLAELLERINRFEPRSIALTFILAEPDRTSLSTIQNELKNNFGLTLDAPPWPDDLLDNDAFLARTLAEGPYILGFKLLFDQEEKGSTNCAMHPRAAVKIEQAASRPSRASLYQATNAVCNLTHFNTAAGSTGHLNGKADPDGRLRRLPLVIQWGNTLYPSLALAALNEAGSSAPITLHSNVFGQRHLKMFGKVIPLDAHGNAQIRFADRGFEPRRVSAAAILGGKADPADFKQAIVFLGLSAAGMDAAYFSPAGELLTTAAVHASMAQTLLQNHFIRRPDYMPQLEILAALLLSAIFGVCIARMQFVGATMTGIGGVMLIQSLSQLLFGHTGLLFSPLLPAAALLINWLMLMLYKFGMNQRAAHRRSQQAMQLVRASEKELNAIMKAIPDIVFRLDCEGRITFISAAVRNYGRLPEDLIGRPMIELIVPEQRSTAGRFITERRTGARSTSDLEARLLLCPGNDNGENQGRLFSLTTEGLYRDSGPGPHEFIGTQGIARDIHQRKKLEKQLEQAKKMEAIGGLAASVAHDLNNLLSGLVSYPELLLLDLPDDSPLRGKVEIIHQAGLNAANVVQDMLSLARNSIQDHEIVQLNDVVRSFTNMPALHDLQKQHPHIEIDTSLAADLLNIKGSVVHLGKLLLNLTYNAAEAMPAGGTITIETANRYLDVELPAYEKIPAGEYVVLTVKDQGVGIPPEYLSHIFEPFFSKKKMGRSGSGLGMTIVWGTVKDHGGYMDLDSQEGQGSSFFIYLPVNREEKAAHTHRVVLEDCVGHETVLIVDDSRDQREITSNMLARLGYKALTAASGEEAADYLQKHTVDLVVLDMVMPGGMDGLETFSRIKELRPGQKAVVVSGYSESQRIQAVLDLGAGTFVGKPFTLEKIGMAIRSVLGPNPQTGSN